MTESDTTENFIQLLAEHQNRLYGYIFSLLGDHDRTADVLQESNLVLWRKVHEFQTDKPFLPWAFAIARFQVLAHLRDQKRDRLLLDAGLAELLSQDSERHAEQIDAVREALGHCLTSLTARTRKLLEQRYFQSLSIADIASTVGQTANSVKVALLRGRRQIADCIQRRLAARGVM